ncbi:MAG: hypothetical protein MR992_01530, partial [Lachnospiraceae bacterium]|nr:hypothetical protein [Lachnospiraceae bacterium]
MLINGIGMNEMPPSFGGATKTTKAGDEVQFPKNVMKCVASGEQKVMLCQDALMSYASPQTGETVNIYRSDSYTEDNPIYVIKGLDADGNAYEQEVDANKINPNKCSFNELMVLNVETGHASPKDYLHAVAVRENAGTHSYSQTSDYISHIESVMKDMKTLGQWDSY